MKLNFLLILIFCTSLNAISQYEVNIPKGFAKEPINMLYVAYEYEDTTSIYAQKLMNVFRANWKQSPVTFVKFFDREILKPGNLFFDMYKTDGTEFDRPDFSKILERDPAERQSKMFNGPKVTKKASDYYFYFVMWTVTGKKKSYSSLDIYDLIKADIFSKYATDLSIVEKKKPYKFFEQGDGRYVDSNLSINVSYFDSTITNYYLNTTVGHIKNYVQSMDKLIEAKKDLKPYYDIAEKDELSNLANQTLYVPNYWYGDDGCLLNKSKYTKDDVAECKQEIDEIFSEYPYKYKVVTRKELSDMILNAKGNIYYLSWIQSNSLKMTNVYNGFTGKRIYADNTYLSKKFKSKDLKKLIKTIN